MNSVRSNNFVYTIRLQRLKKLSLWQRLNLFLLFLNVDWVCSIFPKILHTKIYFDMLSGTIRIRICGLVSLSLNPIWIELKGGVKCYLVYGVKGGVKCYLVYGEIDLLTLGFLSFNSQLEVEQELRIVHATLTLNAEKASELRQKTGLIELTG